MTGTYGFLHKTMGVIFNFDKMVGSEFEKGLADLKTQAEAPTLAAIPSSDQN
jgi:hypothetical protein